MFRKLKSHSTLPLGLTLGVALLVAGLLPRFAEARAAVPDQAFLDREISVVNALAAEPPAGPGPALTLVRSILDRRKAAVGELAASMSLTSFNGIETTDRYDRAVLLALDAVARAGLEADPSMPPEAHAARFAEVMGNPPSLGEKPIAFMVLEYSAIVVTTADLLENDPAAPAPSPAQMALFLILGATTDYRTVQDDFLVASKAESVRQNAVILRMRCPQDGGSYVVNTMKNKVGGDGEISTIYFLECPICHVPDVVEFPLDIATRLNRASERQHLKKPPQPSRPAGGLRP